MTRTPVVCLLLAPLLAALPAAAQAPPPTFLPTAVFPAEDDARLLKAFEGLRVADVSDGMDMAGLQDVGLVDPEIHALWRDVEDFGHRLTGIAVTVRYVPTN